jgi:hypothetical protein
MGIFLQDLEAGEAVEIEVAKRLAKFWGPRGYLPVLKERAKGHDIKLLHPSARPILIEVKYDEKSEYTRNVAIEFQCSGKWSGIAATKADFWVIKYFDDGWKDGQTWRYRAVPTCKLVEEWRSHRYAAVYGGDECRARMILIPVRAFSTFGVLI